MKTLPFCAHDLIYGIKKEEIVLDQNENYPSWFSKLEAPYFAVIRRDKKRGGFIPIGIRGKRKDERLAAFVLYQSFYQIISPTFITQNALWQKYPFLQEYPSFKELDSIAHFFTALKVSWGITGSLGYELITKIPCITKQSDLDIIVTLKKPDHELLLSMKNYIQNYPFIDLQIQTPIGAFSLKEWKEDRCPILLKTDEGAFLTNKLWSRYN
jgi:phosphoribosyl-dephospho-CoA transferase